MFIKIIKDSYYPDLYLVGCTKCNVGDVMPWHPTWTVTDVYNFVADFWRDPLRTPIVFKYPSLPEDVYEYFKANVTYGEIKVETMTNCSDE